MRLISLFLTFSTLFTSLLQKQPPLQSKPNITTTNKLIAANVRIHQKTQQISKIVKQTTKKDSNNRVQKNSIENNRYHKKKQKKLISIVKSTINTGMSGANLGMDIVKGISDSANGNYKRKTPQQYIQQVLDDIGINLNDNQDEGNKNEDDEIRESCLSPTSAVTIKKKKNVKQFQKNHRVVLAKMYVGNSITSIREKSLIDKSEKKEKFEPVPGIFCLCRFQIIKYIQEVIQQIRCDNFIPDTLDWLPKGKKNAMTCNDHCTKKFNRYLLSDGIATC